MILFIDSSALVKLYIAEPGSERMREAVAQADSVAASRLAFAEIHATFARRRRERLLLADELEQLRDRFANDWEELTQVSIRAEVLTLAEVPTPSISRAPCSCGKRNWKSPSPAPTNASSRRPLRKGSPLSIRFRGLTAGVPKGHRHNLGFSAGFQLRDRDQLHPSPKGRRYGQGACTPLQRGLEPA